MEYDNPATRLLNVIESTQNYPQNQNCLSVWRELIGPAADDFELVARVGKMMSLTDEIITELKTHYPTHGESWSHWASQVNLAFMTQNLHGAWGTFRDCIDSHTVNYGFYPANTDTSVKPHHGAGGVSWQSERSTARSSSVRRSA